MVGNQFDKKIKMFRSDYGGEYITHKFRAFLAGQGTVPQLTCPATPQQNGIAKRKHRHIIETTRSLIYSSHAPLCFFRENCLNSYISK